MASRAFKGLLWLEELLEVFYGQKSFQRSTMTRRAVRGILWIKKNIAIFGQRNFEKSSVARRDFKYLLCLFDFFILLEQLLRSSMARKAFKGLLRLEELLKNFYGQKSCQKSCVARRAFKCLLVAIRTFKGLL